MITNKDVEKLKETFATKKDLERFVTKEDLKENLKRFATKDDLKSSMEEMGRHFDVVAEDIKSEFRLVAEQLSSNNDKLKDHDRKIDNLETEVSKLEIRMIVAERKAS